MRYSSYNDCGKMSSAKSKLELVVEKIISIRKRGSRSTNFVGEANGFLVND